MKGRVLITGASGFVGSHLIEGALQEGLEVFAAVRPSSNITHLHGLPVNFEVLNFSDPNGLCVDFREKRYDYVIHAAGLTKARSLQEYNEVNAEYTRNLAYATLKSGISLKRFVFISSLAALGPAKGDGCLTASCEPAPVTSYGKSKLLAEQYLHQFKSLPLTVIRPTAVYGPRERDIYILIKTIARGLELYIGKNRQKLSFIYVKDLVAATLKSMNVIDVKHTVYNLCDGRIYDKYALANIIKEILSKKTLRVHLPLGIVEMMSSLLGSVSSLNKTVPALNKEKLNELSATNWSCSIDELQKDLEFYPEYDLKKGLEETLLWYKENKWL
jgi:nucleoside-diphosphate-sugar epimerase